MLQVINCKVGMMKSQKDADGLFALVAMENSNDVNVCITKLNQTLFHGHRILVLKVCVSNMICCSFAVIVSE